MDSKNTTKKPIIIRVYAKNFIGDFFQSLKNIIGGRLKGYERLLDVAVKETITAFRKKYPRCRKYSVNLKEFTTGAIIVIVQGV